MQDPFKLAEFDRMFPPDRRIVGWENIARAVSKILDCSCCVRGAKRKAAHGRANRLPVWKFAGACAVFLDPEHLKAWAKLCLVPSGARAPQQPKPKRRGRPPTRRVAEEEADDDDLGAPLSTPSASHHAASR